MRLRRRANPRLAVVDVETTGLYRYDRIVEFACVTVVDGAVVDEYDTLIQPDRDPGRVAVPRHAGRRSRRARTPSASRQSR